MTLFLIDTSAAARTSVAAVRDLITDLTNDRLAATCATLDLEAAFSARAGSQVELLLLARTKYLINLPLTEAVAHRARRTMYLLAEKGLHRAAGPIDVLTAAVAEHHDATVLHYDADFEHIAAVTGLRHRWVAPRGSID